MAKFSEKNGWKKEQSIEENNDILKDLPPPPPPPPTCSTYQLLSHVWDEDKDFNQMSETELNDLTHKIFVQQFAFARVLACALSEGWNNRDLEKYIIQESIKELEFLLDKKMNEKNCKKYILNLN